MIIRQKNIEISILQLNSLLDEKQKESFDFLLNNGVYCAACNSHKNGTNIFQVILNELNDIMVHGTCKVCEGKVTRIIELGEEKTFYQKAIFFRETLMN